MKYEASHHVAIWIDFHQAILFALEAGTLDRSGLHRPGDDWSQDRVDAQQYPSLQQYYEAVLSHLQSQDEVLIVGPGWAKRELRQRIEQHGGLRGRVVGLYDAPKLTEAELVFPTGELCA